MVPEKKERNVFLLPSYLVSSVKDWLCYSWDDVLVGEYSMFYEICTRHISDIRDKDVSPRF